jgi:hypothetical protein
MYYVLMDNAMNRIFIEFGFQGERESVLELDLQQKLEE